MKGRIAWFSRKKGYGFIHPDDDTRDVFLHINQIPEEMELFDGDAVEYETETTNKGVSATKVRLVE